MPLTQGQILKDRYRIVKLLGQGGFGAVYRAWDTTLNVPCAVKESFELSPEGQRQFLREAQILAGLRHPNLPRVTDYFAIPGQGQYLVMDFVEGEDLEALRAQAGGRLPESQVLPWMSQVCEALDYLHSQTPAVIHRDIKPANIKITPPDKYHAQGRAILVDFGVAKTYDPVMRTTMGARAVTPGFSPHEQYGQTQAATDARTDIYALGATLYSLLTGQDPPESILRMVSDPLAPPSRLAPNISPAVEAAILKAMQMDPGKRFQSAAEFSAGISGQSTVRSDQLSVGSDQSSVSSGPAPVITQPPASPPLARQAAAPAAAPAPSPLSPATLGMPLPRPARRFPWKRVGIGAGVLIGLALLLVAILRLAEGGVNAIRQLPISRSLTQTAQIVAVAPLQTQTPLPPAVTFTPTFLPSTLTPTPTFPVISTATYLVPSSTSSSAFEYTVQEGDTLYDIAVRFGTDISTLMALNPSIDPVNPFVSVGQVILISAPNGMPSPQISPVDGMLLSYIPAGTFLMGEEGVAEPVHTVTLDAFWMDQTEVTNGMYALCVADGACTPPNDTGSYTRSSYYREAAYADYPVIWVGWNQAAAYCEWAGRQLPTEAQWEYAARGGLAGALYPWGNTFDGELANFCDANCSLDWSDPNFDDGYGDTAPVGSYPANGYGLYDMAGNVWEWVADWYGLYSSAAVENPTGPASGEYRLLRGGSWSSDEYLLRVSYRNWYPPDFTDLSLGFRCSLSP